MPELQIQNNVSLKAYNTFGIDVKAKYFASINSVEELLEALKQNRISERFILGGGSNLLLTKDIDALVLHINLKGIEIVSQNGDKVLVKAAAGENWHEFVLWCLDHDFGGIENLSLIPGNVGTAPIQNIGAYGVELKDVFVSCDAIDINTLELISFSKDDCKFGYRNSIFKNVAKGKYIITSVTLQLSANNHELNMSYGAIASEIKKNNINSPCIKDISNTVIHIRQSKLPDPSKIGNSGSFFKNPVISVDSYEKLKQNFTDLPGYPVSDTEAKVPAGWLIETAGFKGKRFDTYGVHKDQALVLVNYGNATGKAIMELSILIQNTVERIFGIKLEAEVNII